MTEEKKKRGFATLPREQVSEIARKGGKAAHVAGTAHEWTSEQAREAGRKGGAATHAKRRAVKAAAFNQEAKEASESVSEADRNPF